MKTLSISSDSSSGNNEPKLRPRAKHYVIPGDPIALARPRFARGMVYDCQKQRKLSTAITLQNQHGDLGFFEGPLQIEMNFYMGYAIRRGPRLDGQWHTRVPDLDNCVKYICDTAMGVLYADDRIVVRIIATKRFSLDPRTEFTISEIDL